MEIYRYRYYNNFSYYWVPLTTHTSNLRYLFKYFIPNSQVVLTMNIHLGGFYVKLFRQMSDGMNPVIIEDINQKWFIIKTVGRGRKNIHRGLKIGNILLRKRQKKSISPSLLTLYFYIFESFLINELAWVAINLEGSL